MASRPPGRAWGVWASLVGVFGLAVALHAAEPVELRVLPHRCYRASDRVLPQWRLMAVAINRLQETLTLQRASATVRGPGQEVTWTQTGEEINCILQGSREVPPAKVVVLSIVDQGPAELLARQVALDLTFAHAGGQSILVHQEIPLTRHYTLHLRFPLEGEWLVVNSRAQQHGVGTAFALDLIAPSDLHFQTDPPGGSLCLADFASDGRPVLSPVDGTVVDCVADQPDCVPTPDRASFAGKRPDSRRDLAGNYVVIAVRRGACVLMAHFRQGSLRVKPGARVRKGQYLAQVGNSGNTTGPHLHIEVLDGPPDLALLGTTRLQQSGLPFGFRDVLRRRGDKVEYLRRAVPEEGDVLSVVPPVAAPG